MCSNLFLVLIAVILLFSLYSQETSIRSSTIFAVTSDLDVPVAVCSWFLPDNHAIYSEFKRSIKHTSISTIMSKLESFEGIIKNELAFSKDPSPSCSSCCVVRYTVAVKLEHYEEDGPLFQACIFLKSPDCELLCGGTSCSNCSSQSVASKLSNCRKCSFQIFAPE